MKKCPSKRIKYLKTLQHLATKYKTSIEIKYFLFTPLSGTSYYRWNGTLTINNDIITVADTNFTQMLQKLHYEIRNKEKEII